MEIARHLTIRGRVQGVWYRAWMAEQAEALGVRGWVRNRSDSTVEALVVGSADALEGLITRCRQGPPAARVDSIDSEKADPADAGPAFEKRTTLA
ncbi:acylphosphatase [Allosphingosinicella indica]|uniref:acylphosphatase n=1 Tax=Allosphingosinicella indica TaxID=941907 RepID=A0A1X7GDK6_9SPHN|nr:acylphosphatase [Allosphingosinicella indica]SMF68167.1 acylphosphatase [Allosphingosinicella indica]